MDNVKVNGVIKSISEKVVNDYGTRLEYVVEHTETNDNGTWVTPLKIEMFKKGDYVSHVDNFLEYNKVGDSVCVEFQVRGREWTSPEGVVKIFNSFNHWRCDKVEGAVLAVEGDEKDLLPF